MAVPRATLEVVPDANASGSSESWLVSVEKKPSKPRCSAQAAAAEAAASGPGGK